METYELTPIFSNQQSFYKKATIKRGRDTEILYSYNTPVACVQEGIATFTHEENLLTATTLKHIKEFLQQKGFVVNTKRKMIEDYGDFKM